VKSGLLCWGDQIIRPIVNLDESDRTKITAMISSVMKMKRVLGYRNVLPKERD